MNIDIYLSTEKFVDYLSPILGELGTDVLQLESPRCSDNDGFNYLVKSKHYKYKNGMICPDWDEESVFEIVANELKQEIIIINTQKQIDNIELNTDKLGIYNIFLQINEWKDEDIKKMEWLKEYKYMLIIWIRYAFGKKDEIGQNQNV